MQSLAIFNYATTFGIDPFQVSPKFKIPTKFNIKKVCKAGKTLVKLNSTKGINSFKIVRVLSKSGLLNIKVTKITPLKINFMLYFSIIIVFQECKKHYKL